MSRPLHALRKELFVSMSDAATTPSLDQPPAEPPTPAAPPTSDEPPQAPESVPSEEEIALEDAWGRVSATGAVDVRSHDGWRRVGEFPDGTPAEALAYFARKFDDLAFKVSTLEQRHARGGASAGDLRTQATKLRAEIDDAAVVGDLAGLTERVTALGATLAEASAEEQAAAKAAVEAGIAEREAIVAAAEALAARDPKTVQWKQTTADLAELFDRWQAHQKDGPRLPKGQTQALWKRFRDARSSIERDRRTYFAEVDEAQKVAKAAKTRLIERAEALAPRGEDAIAEYRSLLDEWKRAPRAGRKADDVLWARFKAAGDVLYQARTARDEAEHAESGPRIEKREELLTEAARVADISDLGEARRVLTGIQRAWDEVGRIVPRERERALDDRLRKIERDLKAREDEDWRRNSPETTARANDFSGQLQESIDRLTAEIADAEAAGDSSLAADRREELAARQAWLRAISS